MLHSDALGITEQFVRQYTHSGCRRYAQFMALLDLDLDDNLQGPYGAKRR